MLLSGSSLFDFGLLHRTVDVSPIFGLVMFHIRQIIPSSGFICQDMFSVKFCSQNSDMNFGLIFRLANRPAMSTLAHSRGIQRISDGYNAVHYPLHSTRVYVLGYSRLITKCLAFFSPEPRGSATKPFPGPNDVIASNR